VLFLVASFSSQPTHDTPRYDAPVPLDEFNGILSLLLPPCAQCSSPVTCRHRHMRTNETFFGPTKHFSRGIPFVDRQIISQGMQHEALRNIFRTASCCILCDTCQMVISQVSGEGSFKKFYSNLSNVRFAPLTEGTQQQPGIRPERGCKRIYGAPRPLKIPERGRCGSRTRSWVLGRSCRLSSLTRPIL
jgi:hypothetical protein